MDDHNEHLPLRLVAALGDGTHVGRERELDLVRRTLRRSAPGLPSCAVVVGQAGMGKTRLAAEAAAAHKGTVLYGRCDEDLDRPYQPLAECLAPLVEKHG